MLRYKCMGCNKIVSYTDDLNHIKDGTILICPECGESTLFELWLSEPSQNMVYTKEDDANSIPADGTESPKYEKSYNKIIEGAPVWDYSIALALEVFTETGKYHDADIVLKAEIVRQLARIADILEGKHK